MGSYVKAELKYMWVFQVYYGRETLKLGKVEQQMSAQEALIGSTLMRSATFSKVSLNGMRLHHSQSCIPPSAILLATFKLPMS